MASNYETLDQGTNRWGVNSSQPTFITQNNIWRLDAERARMGFVVEDPCASRWLGHSGLDTERRASGEWTSGYTGRGGCLPTDRFDAWEDALIALCDREPTVEEHEELGRSDCSECDELECDCDDDNSLGCWVGYNEADDDLRYDADDEAEPQQMGIIRSHRYNGDEYPWYEYSEFGSWKRMTRARRQYDRHANRRYSSDVVAPETRVIEDDLSHLAFCEVEKRFAPEPIIVESAYLEPLESWEVEIERKQEEEAYYIHLYGRCQELRRCIAELEHRREQARIAEMEALCQRYEERKAERARALQATLDEIEASLKGYDGVTDDWGDPSVIGHGRSGQSQSKAGWRRKVANAA